MIREDDHDPIRFFTSMDNWSEQDYTLTQPDSQFPSSQSETYMVGFTIANIVGLKYYQGTISGREMVGLVREPLNVWDNNAIRVLNTRSVQVGHIERTVAVILASLIDAQMISVEAIVPNTRGNGNKFKIPCQVHIFTQFEFIDAVKDTVSQDNLDLIFNSDASFMFSDAMVVKERREESGFKSLDKIFELVDKNVSKKGEMLGAEPLKEVIKSDLFPHQKEGLGWSPSLRRKG